MLDRSNQESQMRTFTAHTTATSTTTGSTIGRRR
jgi:hypothetical protein